MSTGIVDYRCRFRQKIAKGCGEMSVKMGRTVSPLLRRLDMSLVCMLARLSMIKRSILRLEPLLDL